MSLRLYHSVGGWESSRDGAAGSAVSLPEMPGVMGSHWRAVLFPGQRCCLASCPEEPSRRTNGPAAHQAHGLPLMAVSWEAFVLG